jgi:hypothetical protein
MFVFRYNDLSPVLDTCFNKKRRKVQVKGSKEGRKFVRKEEKRCKGGLNEGRRKVSGRTTRGC